MPLIKQPVSINFAQGVSTKADPYQVEAGKFLALSNMVFTETGRLTKRNGFPELTKLPDALQTTLTTLNNNLLATGSNLYAYSSDTDTWLDKGVVQPVSLSTQALVRSTTSQSAPDIAVADTGLTCLVYTDSSQAYYQISDSSTGQLIVNRTTLPTTAGQARVYILGRFFIITYIATVAATPHLQYVAIPTSQPSNPRAAVDISTSVASLTAGYDCYVANNNLYVSWASSVNTILTARLSSTLVLSTAVAITTTTASLISVTVDSITSNVWVTMYDGVTDDGYVAVYSSMLSPILAKTQVINNIAVNEVTSTSLNGTLQLFYEVDNTYSYTPNAKTDYIEKLTVTEAGTVSAASVILRSVGLASKAFIHTNDNTYILVTYGEANQPTYFLIDSLGNIYMRLAYANGGGYKPTQVLSNVCYVNGSYYTPYIIKTQLTPVNKGTGNPGGTPVNALYAQTGVNLVKFEINTSGQYSSEIANTLHLTGGQMWQYDGVKPVEQGFHIYPENNTVTTSAAGGLITAQDYFYSFTYEWNDNQGNLHRSAPSIPVKITTTGGTSTNTLNVPTLRLTYKTSPNPVRIVGYRWSTAQQTYYQFTSITSPTVNNPAVDSVTIVDTLADSSILGNTILYTTGGVLENIAPPASIASALYKNRVFLISAEDRNTIWYSKPILPNTPVEFSDLQTIYVAPTSGAQGSTGECKAVSAMDDKLIITKSNALYYITGNGPDVTGANNDFSEPVFITSAVGTDNPRSIVLMPAGLMMQSNKGIWLLGRDLNTSYIGADVEEYNSYICYSAQVIPGTNQVRFIMNNRITLMYDYYQGQWATHTNLTAISSTLFNGADTYLSDRGHIYQETEGMFKDGSTPVLLGFTTNWFSLAGINGFQRFYELLMLGTYHTPFKLNVEFAYDFNPSFVHNAIVTPDNYSPLYGNEPVYGAGKAYGGPGNVLKLRVFPETQKCDSFQVRVTEVYDPSYSITAGEGLSLSGFTAVIGAKRVYRTNKAGQSFG